jgi:hypothetical protein
MPDYIDDDRDVITVKPLPNYDEKPRVDLTAAVEKAIDKELSAEAGVAVRTRHIEAGGFWRKTVDGGHAFVARVRASFGGGK